MARCAGGCGVAGSCQVAGHIEPLAGRVFINQEKRSSLPSPDHAELLKILTVTDFGAVREIPARHGLPAVFGGVSRPGERQEALLNRCRLTKNRRAQLTRPQGVPTSTPKPRRLVKTGEDGVPPKIRDGQKIRSTLARFMGDIRGGGVFAVQIW